MIPHQNLRPLAPQLTTFLQPRIQKTKAELTTLYQQPSSEHQLAVLPSAKLLCELSPENPCYKELLEAN